MTAIEDILGEQGISLVSSQSFTGPLPLDPVPFFKNIKDQGGRLIFGLFSDAAARVLLCEAYRQVRVTGSFKEWGIA